MTLPTTLLMVDSLLYPSRQEENNYMLYTGVEAGQRKKQTCMQECLGCCGLDSKSCERA